MNSDISLTSLTEKGLVHRSLIQQIVVQAMAVLLFWWAVDALVRTAIELYEEFDLELPVNTINFVVRPGAAGVMLGFFNALDCFARVPAISPLPSPVLRTDYRLRSIAAGDRARCSLKGEGATHFL